MSALAPPLESFGQRLLRLRLANDLSKNRLSKLSGLPRISLGRLERGVYLPRYGTLIALADALGVSLDELAGRGSR